MTAREWKPGDVAMMRCRDGAERVAMLTDRGNLSPLWIAASEDWGRLHDDTPVRPLVVIDPEDGEDVARLCAAYRSVDHTIGIMPMQAALREFAAPTPQIEEPTEIGARVIDADGEMWVRHKCGEWSCLNSRPGTDVRNWDELTTQYGPVEVRP